MLMKRRTTATMAMMVASAWSFSAPLRPLSPMHQKTSDPNPKLLFASERRSSPPTSSLLSNTKNDIINTNINNDVDNYDLSPPWSFKASYINYQFHLIPTTAATKYCPEDVFLFNLGGVTLGGIFCVEYTESPVGQYREVAFLSGLVGRASGIGAWASHIIVDSNDAAHYGEKFWGLPAEVLPIDFEDSLDDDDESNVYLRENSVKVSGWKTANKMSTLPESSSVASKPNLFSWLDISLPSFSGRLPIANDENNGVGSSANTISPLLRYPLRIRSPQSIHLTNNNNGYVHIEGNTGRMQTELRELFSDSVPLISIRIENVKLTAGVAMVECE